MTNLEKVEIKDVNFNCDYRPHLNVRVACPYCGHKQPKQVPMFTRPPKIFSCWGCKKHFTLQLSLYARAQMCKLVEEA